MPAAAGTVHIRESAASPTAQRFRFIGWVLLVQVASYRRPLSVKDLLLGLEDKEDAAVGGAREALVGARRRRQRLEGGETGIRGSRASRGPQRVHGAPHA